MSVFRWGDRAVRVVDGEVVVDAAGTAHRSFAKAPKHIRERLREMGWEGGRLVGSAAGASDGRRTVRQHTTKED